MVVALGCVLSTTLLVMAVALRRRFPGALPVLIGGVALAGITLASCQPSGPGVASFTTGVALSVGLCWLGYRLQCSAPHEAAPSLLLATLAAASPSARSIRPEDVLGSWQFYVDAASSTVTIDLRQDGRYRQVILGNGGERVEGPGGTWTLDGPYLELTAYRSAVRAATERVRWIFGDWEKKLVLFAKDDSNGESTFLGQRRRPGE